MKQQMNVNLQTLNPYPVNVSNVNNNVDSDLWQETMDQKHKQILKELKKTGIKIRNDEAGFYPGVTDDILKKYRKSKLPVLKVPFQYEFTEIKRIVYLTDLRYFNYEEMAKTAQIARYYDAELFIMHTPLTGLPEIPAAAASEIFKESIYPRINFQKVELLTIQKETICSNVIACITNIDPQIIALSAKSQAFPEFRHPTLIFPTV